MRRLALVVVLVAAGCGSLSGEQARRLDSDLQTYVRLVPKRAAMDAAELASHDALGKGCLDVTGRVSGRIQ